MQKCEYLLQMAFETINVKYLAVVGIWQKVFPAHWFSVYPEDIAWGGILLQQYQSSRHLQSLTHVLDKVIFKNLISNLKVNFFVCFSFIFIAQTLF